MDSTDPTGRNLRTIRLRRQWSYADVAAATGFDAEVIEGLERGATFLSRSRLAELAERLDVPLEDLTDPTR